jgi:hypothetical protein
VSPVLNAAPVFAATITAFTVYVPVRPNPVPYAVIQRILPFKTINPPIDNTSVPFTVTTLMVAEPAVFEKVPVPDFCANIDVILLLVILFTSIVL